MRAKLAYTASRFGGKRNGMGPLMGGVFFGNSVMQSSRPGQTLEGDLLIARRGRRGLPFGGFGPGTLLAGAAAEEAHRLRHNLVRGGGGSVRAGIGAWVAGGAIGREASLDPHLAPLGKVLLARLGLFAPSGDADPNRFFHLLPRGVIVGAVDSDGKRGDRLPVRRVAHLGIAAEVTDQNDFVEHSSPPPRVERRMTPRPGRVGLHSFYTGVQRALHTPAAMSFVMRAWASATGIAPGFSPERKRTATAPCSTSLSPTTSMYGTFCICASRILAFMRSGRVSTSTRSPAARSWVSTDCAYSRCRSAMGITTACTGASQTGKAPAKCSMSTPMKRSIEPSRARWIMYGRCSCPSSPMYVIPKRSGSVKSN